MIHKLIQKFDPCVNTITSEALNTNIWVHYLLKYVSLHNTSFKFFLLI